MATYTVTEIIMRTLPSLRSPVAFYASVFSALWLTACAFDDPSSDGPDAGNGNLTPDDPLTSGASSTSPTTTTTAPLTTTSTNTPPSSSDTGFPSLPPGAPSDETSMDGDTVPPLSPSSSPEDVTEPPIETTGPSSTSDDVSTLPNPNPDAPEVPDGDHCADVAEWDPDWASLEDEVLEIVNQVRAKGADCGSQGSFGPAGPLTTEPALRCAARLHSVDMHVRNFFAHDNLDGVDPFQRMEAAGFVGSYMGENIAYGPGEPADVMAMWMDSDGHCANIMNPNFTLLGVGYHPGSSERGGRRHFWTQNFGAPRRSGGGRPF